MPGDLPRTTFERCGSVRVRTRLSGFALVLAGVALLAWPVRARADRAAGADPIPPAALAQLAEMRRGANCLLAPTEDVGRETAFRRRPALEIKGRAIGGDEAGLMLDLALFDTELGRIVSYTCFSHDSTRRSGEAIVSLAEGSVRADQLTRTLLPGLSLDLESIKRYRKEATESLYYEASYASGSGEFPFVDPPVRLLLNASTGSLFRVELDPDWLAPPDPPRVGISRKAAERIAAVVLGARDLTPVFGAGAALTKVAPAEMYTVHPNDWLGFFANDGAARARVAWVVPFQVKGAAAAGIHNLYIDAASGHVLGGASGKPAGLQTP